MPRQGRRATQPEPWTSEQWVRYFIRNRRPRGPIPGQQGPTLTPSERAAISKSIAEFQLGESSEGRNLVAAADQHARQSGDAAYRRAIALFIGEENRHARHLGRFMDREGIARQRSSMVDHVFRRMRRFGGIEIAITVLLTAEIIAQVYYRALWRSTRSADLRALCARILGDERQHVRFQCERLALLRRRRRRVLVELAALAHRLLIEVAVAVVFSGHRPVLRRGGFDYRGFRRRVWSYAEKALALADAGRLTSGGVPDSGALAAVRSR